MDSTVQAALIGVGGALLGFAASALTATMTMRASRDAAHEQRLWEKRSGVYEGILTTLTTEPGNLEETKSRLERFSPQVAAYASGWVVRRYRDVMGELAAAARVRDGTKVAAAKTDAYRAMAALEEQIRIDLQLPSLRGRARRGAHSIYYPHRSRPEPEQEQDPQPVPQPDPGTPDTTNEGRTGGSGVDADFGLP
jgi:hypothetical protein